MGFWEGLFRPTSLENQFFFDTLWEAKSGELQIKELLIEHAVDLIAKTIAKSEIQVFRDKQGKVEKVTDDIYYLLNIRPNYNQDGTPFMYQIVRTLLMENEALVVRVNRKLYVADSWTETNDVLVGKKYTNVVISDGGLETFEIKETLYADDVMYMTLGQSKMTNILHNYYTDYAQLIKASSDGYIHSKANKYKLTLPHGTQTQLIDPVTKKEVSYEEYKDRLAGNVLDNKSSITMFGSQFDLELLNTTKTTEKASDYTELVKAFGDKIAMAFNIPLDVFYGEQTDKSNATNEFITFAVSPIIEIIEDSFNAKLISEPSYLKGERIRFNTYTMKHFDIMEVANSLDKLFAIGWSHNDLRDILKQPVIREDWANRHHITKNYMDVNDTNFDEKIEVVKVEKDGE